MFTGLVEEMGIVESLHSTGSVSDGMLLTVSCDKMVDGMILGDSIAVNGVCLTVRSFCLKGPGTNREWFQVGLAPETLRLTSLGTLKVGGAVNLERSVMPVTRMGGHFVQGHVDGVGKIVQKLLDGDSVVFEIEASKDLLDLIVKKGYVAIDGASLTVTHCDQRCFRFMLIEYTQQKIVTAKKEIGDLVNIGFYFEIL